MPLTTIILYLEDDRSIPVRDWLDGLSADAQDRCLARLALLEEFGYELRRPHAEYLEGTDLYELRVKYHRVNLRMLYFFHERTTVVVSHGFSKERKIPPKEIALATERMKKFRADPERHTPRDEDNEDTPDG
jgi:phage-related protein